MFMVRVLLRATYVLCSCVGARISGIASVTHSDSSSANNLAMVVVSSRNIEVITETRGRMNARARNAHGHTYERTHKHVRAQRARTYACLTN
jgi:hypothetical protein